MVFWRALALSLQEIQTTQHHKHSEDAQFEADVQRAIEASKHSPESKPDHLTTQQSSFLSERAQLEKARLERQKRLRNDGNDTEEDEPRSKRQRLSSLSRARTHDKAYTFVSDSPSPTAPNGSADAVPAAGLFWDGEIRQTGNKYADHRKDTKPTFHLTDIIGDVSYFFFLLEFYMIYELNTR